MKKKLVCLILVGIFLISSIAFFIKRERSPAILESGYCLKLKGEISNVTYINTSYGKIPLFYLPSFIDVLKSKGMWSPKLYQLTGGNNGYFYIMGKIGGEYHAGDDFNTTLHFQKICFDGIELYWFREIPLHVGLLLSLHHILEENINIHHNLFLVEKERNASSTSYEIILGGNRSFNLDSVNISLKKFEMNESYGDEITFPSAFENIISSLANIYATIFNLNSSPLSLIDCFHDGFSKEKLIEIVDANRNDHLDSGDILQIKIPPTPNDTILESYFLTLDTPWSNQTLFLKTFLNWYQGPIEITDRKVLLIEDMEEEKGDDFLNLSVEIGPTLPPSGIPYSKLRIETVLNHTYHKSANISENLSSMVLNNISIRFMDVNNNFLLDSGDWIKMSGIPLSTPASTYLLHKKENINLFRWKKGE